MTLSGHQPNYLPNLSFFSKMKQVDLFVVVTNVQLQRDKGWQRRNKIKNKNGDLWLTVPVVGNSRQLVRDTLINNKTPWQSRHRRTLQATYGKTASEPLLCDVLRMYDKQWQRLADLNWALIMRIRSLLEIKTPCILDEEVGGSRHDLVINVCQKYGADAYVAGEGGHGYIDSEYESALKKAGLSFRYMDQDIANQYPYSSIHYLLAYGPEWVKERL